MLIMDICENPIVFRILYYIRYAMDIISIVVPIGLILKVILDVYQSVMNADTETVKDNNKKIISRVVAAIIIFLVPTVVKIIFSFDTLNKVDYIDCWNRAVDLVITDVYFSGNGRKIDLENDFMQCMGKSDCWIALPEVSDSSFIGWSYEQDCDNIYSPDSYRCDTNSINDCFNISPSDGDITLYACYSD